MEALFPGMDPYLEQPSLWADVHHRLITVVCDQILSQLNPKYTAVITSYVALETLDAEPLRIGMAVPDVGVLDAGIAPARADDPSVQTAVSTIEAPALTVTVPLEVSTTYGQIEIRTVDGEQLVTAIALLSPANKRPGPQGADAYEQKRRAIFRSWTHLLEIDLLRAGQRPLVSQTPPLPPEPYFAFLSRAGQRPLLSVWPIGLRRALPVLPVPLLAPDPDLPLDLNAALRQVYRAARYERRINYRADPPLPAFSADDLAWIDALLRERGLRTAETPSA